MNKRPGDPDSDSSQGEEGEEEGENNENESPDVKEGYATTDPIQTTKQPDEEINETKPEQEGEEALAEEG